MCECRFYCKEDFAYFVMNEIGKDSRILIRSGGGKPLIILSENFIQNRWNTLIVYTPKFCPECGRKLEALQ